jgi:peptide/nickel transport system ATP-binding protein
VKVENLSTVLDVAAGKLRAVDRISFEVKAGECFALVGESGCGKSMTALSLMRLLPEAARIEAGRVELGGVDLLRLPEAAMRAVRGKRVSMIFQEPATALNPVLTVGQQIEEVIRRHAPGGNPTEKSIQLLRAVGLPNPEERYHQYPFQLSGGQRQRVMIAGALAVEPEVLIADEPTTALDVTIQAQILDLLAKLQAERGMALLLITHDLGIVAKMADRVAVMYAGEIVELAEREAFMRAPQHPYSQKLFAALPSPQRRAEGLAVIRGQVPPLTQEFRSCRFADRCDFVFDRCRVEAPPLYEPLKGHLARCFLRDRGPADPRKDSFVQREARVQEPVGQELLRVRDLKVHFPIRKGIFKRTVGQVKAVDGVSFELREGRTLALVGESGCGKTTTGKALLKLIEPTAGRIAFEGQDLTDRTRGGMHPLRRAMQIIFQDPFSSLNPRKTVRRAIEEVLAVHHLVPREGRRARVDELLERVGLSPELADRRPRQFSGGQRQRIGIARALAVGPEFIVADEPVSALDVSVQAQVLNLLVELQEELDLTYLFISHNLGVVRHVSRRVVVMYLGKIVEEAPTGELFAKPLHPYTQALMQAVPQLDPDEVVEAPAVEGDLPNPINPPSGCHFHPRCPFAMDVCRSDYPALRRVSPGRVVACHLYDGEGS